MAIVSVRKGHSLRHRRFGSGDRAAVRPERAAVPCLLNRAGRIPRSEVNGRARTEVQARPTLDGQRSQPSGRATAAPSIELASYEIPISVRMVGRMSTERIAAEGVAPLASPGHEKAIGMFCTWNWCPP